VIFPFILACFIAVPIIEIFVLIQVGSAIGALATIAIVILTAIVGTWMLRSQGLSTLNKARARLAGGEIPAFQVMEGLALAVGGAMLLTPGFVTDAFGFFCLLPPTRHLLVHFMSKRVSFAGMTSVGGTGPRATPGSRGGKARPADGSVIEGEFTRDDNKAGKASKNGD